jgi:hypothetical protein
LTNQGTDLGAKISIGIVLESFEKNFPNPLEPFLFLAILRIEVYWMIEVIDARRESFWNWPHLSFLQSSFTVYLSSNAITLPQLHE